MPITKATQNVINPSITTLDTDQTINSQKIFRRAYTTTSSSSVTVTELGTRTFIVNDSNLAWRTGDDIYAKYEPFGIVMSGTVQSYNPATNTIIIDVTSASTESGGPYSPWTISSSSTLLLPKGVLFQGNIVPAFQALDLGGNVNFNVNGDSGLISTSVGITRTTENASQLNPMQVHRTEIWGQNWAFATPNQQVILDLGQLSGFDMGGYEAWVSVSFNSFNSSTSLRTYDIGQYTDVFVVRIIETSVNNFGYQVNAVASNTLFPIFTTAGRAVSAGGWSASRYPVAFRAIQGTPTSNGSLTLEIKGHATEDAFPVSYTSEISVVLTKTTIP